MNKKLLTFFISLSLFFTAYGQYAGLQKVIIDQSVNGLESFTVYRIYVQLAHDNDRVISIYGGGTAEVSRIGSNGELFQHPLLGATSSSFIGVDLDQDPTMEFDSFITIGVLPGNSADLIAASDLISLGTMSALEFEAGVGSFNLGNEFSTGELTIGNESDLGLATDENGIFIAQITTTGDLDGVINLKIQKDDGSIELIEGIDLSGNEGCTNPFAANFDPSATFNDASCLFPVEGCTNSDAINFDPNADVDNGTCIIEGCMDPLAENYNESATTDDGSCFFENGCTDPEAVNYTDDAVIDDGSCLYAGCTDQLALNYNSTANLDDGSCIYPIIEGCTDPLADNYNPNAELDDGTCFISGCTDPEALNYDPTADVDDGSCLIPGCTNESALNYNPDANFNDNTCVESCDELNLQLSLDQKEDGHVFGLCDENAGVFPFNAEFFINASSFQSVVIDWGDGELSSFPFIPLDAFHEYTEQNEYTLSIELIADFGCSLERTYTVSGMNAPLVALNLNSDTELCTDEEFSAQILDWESNHPSTTYKIEGNGNGIGQEFAHPPVAEFSHAFNSPSCLATAFDGTEFAYGIRIVAENLCGTSSDALPPLFVSGHTENANTDFTITAVDNMACPGENVSIVNTSNGYISVSSAGCELSNPSQLTISPNEGWEVVGGSMEESGFVTLQFNTPQVYQVFLSDAELCGATEASHTLEVAENSGTIEGLVTIDGDMAVEMKVGAYGWNTEDGEFQLLETTLSDENGNFNFSMNEGFYQVKAIPTDEQEGILPMYTNEVWSWMQAEILQVGCLNDHATDIQLQTMNAPGMNINLSGALYYRDQFKSMEGDPIPGIPIIVEKDTTDSEAVAVTTTNLLGQYSFSEIPPGNYKLLVDMPGLPMAETHYFTIEENDQVMTQMNFYADSLDQIYISDIVSVLEQDLYSAPAIKVFPNPTNGVCKLQLDAEDITDLNIIVHSATGKLMDIPARKGKTGWELDLSELPPGCYVYRLWSSDFVKSGTIIKE